MSKHDRARLGFNMAFDGMVKATNLDALKVEITNALQHSYQMGEVVKHELALNDNAGLNARLTGAQARGSMAALWIRGADTHDVVAVSEMGDAVSGYLGAWTGTLIWHPLAYVLANKLNPDSGSPSIAARRIDYGATFAGQPVMDTLRNAFDDLDALT